MTTMTIGEKIQYLPASFMDKLRKGLSQKMNPSGISARFLKKAKVSDPKRIKVLLDLMQEYNCKMSSRHFYANNFHLYLVKKQQIECRYSIYNIEKTD